MAIQSSFSQMVLTRGFDEIQITDILAEADVARSTFYQHFRSKDDLLCSVMAPMLGPLARAGLQEEPSPHLIHIAEHIWQNRRLGRAVFQGSTRVAIVRHLAGEIGQVLEDVQLSRNLPIAYIASVIAQWEIASLDEWLSGRHRCSARDWALALCHGTRALTKALMGIATAASAPV